MLCNLERYRDLPKRKTAKNLIQETTEFLLGGFLFSGLGLSGGSHGEVGRTCKVSASLLGGTASRGHPLNLLKAELVGAGEGAQQSRGPEVRGASARRDPSRGHEQRGERAG